MPRAHDGEPGTLYVCPTPIGNLEDVTLRVLRVLREADVIAAEDTRRTRALPAHFDIHTPLTSLHRFNEREKAEWLCQRLLAGESVALVSDAGMPGVSDPGRSIIVLALERGVPVTVLPGPSAVLTALVLSGLDTSRFSFEGFLPRKASDRDRRLQELAGDPRTLIFFEAPHRIARTVADMARRWGNRRCALVREMTKIHEEVLRTTLDDLARELSVRPRRGEMVLVVEGETDAVPARRDIDRGMLLRAVEAEMSSGKTKKEAIATVAERYGVPRRDVYEAAVSVSGRPDDRDGE